MTKGSEPMGFNRKVAADFYDEVSKMDDASAEGLLRCVLFDVYTQDLVDNAPLLQAQTSRVHKALTAQVAKSLDGKDGSEALAVAGLVSTISKDWDTPYENHYHREQPRGVGGRWTKTTITLSRDKAKDGSRVHARKKAKDGEFDLTGALKGAGQRTSAFGEEWNKRGQHDATSNAQVYRRVAAGAEAVGGLGGPKVQAVTQTAHFLGQYGPEAEKVVGPAVRRAAYRYRGTERTPDKALISAQRDQSMRLMRQDGLREEQFGVPERFEASTNAAISYLSTRLPSKSLSTLQQQSGKIPPSEGIMLNADGKIITQAVGYSDDHYLPFNLKNLKGLQGGSYIRSRSSGGLTSEDIYTGLVGGARSVTVVSRSGVFTINFDDAFRGGRRYNDKARQMVGRYAQILDAVQSKQVSRVGLSPEQRAEIRAEVEEEIGDFSSRQEIEDEFKKRTKEYQSSSVPSKAEIAEIKQKAMEAASTGGQIKTGSVAGSDTGEKQEHIPADLKSRYNRYYSEMVDDLMAEKESRKYQLDGEGYAAAMDALREQFPYYIDSVKYVHRKNATDVNLRSQLSAETDKGYVKPRYIRPEGAKGGYFDESITGRGKISSDRMNYANWTNNPENKKPEAKAEGEGSLKPVSGNAKQNVAQAVRTARAHAAEDKALADLVKNYASTNLQASQFPALAAAQGASDDDIMNMVKGRDREKLLKEVRSAHQLTGTEQAYAAEHAEGTKLFRAYDAASKLSGGTKFSLEDMGRSPATPFTFDDGPAYLPAAPSETYVKAAKAQMSKGQLGAQYADFDDTKLRAWSTFYGTLAKHAKNPSEGDQELINDLARVLPENEDQDLIEIVVRAQRSKKPEHAYNEAVGKVEAIERLRRIKAMGEEALYSSTKRDGQREAIDGPKKVAATGAPKAKASAGTVVDTFEGESARAEKDGNYELADGYQQLADAVRGGDEAAVHAAFHSINFPHPANRTYISTLLKREGFDV